MGVFAASLPFLLGLSLVRFSVSDQLHVVYLFNLIMGEYGFDNYIIVASTSILYFSKDLSSMSHSNYTVVTFILYYYASYVY